MTDEPITLEAAQQKSLTDWKKAPSVRNLKNDLLEVKTSHDRQRIQIEEWLDHLHITGKAKIKSTNGGSEIVPRLIRKQAEWRYAALSEPFLSTDELFNASPVTAEDMEASKQNQVLLNSQFRTAINRVAFIDEYVRTAVDEGTVILRTGWEFLEEEVEEEVPDVTFVVDPAFEPTLLEVQQLQQESPSMFQTNVPDELKQALEMSTEQGEVIRPIVKGWKKETRKKVVRNRPTVEVCDFRNVLIDPTCQGDMDKANFVIYRFESSLAELKKDGRYKNLTQINVTGNSPLNEPDHYGSADSRNFNFPDSARKKIVVHEYWGFWDINDTGILEPIVAAWVGDTMIRLEANPFPDKKPPFEVVQYLPVRKAIYGEPDGALLIENQRILGAVIRGVIDIMGKSANGQTGIRKDFLDATNRRRFDRGLDYEFNPNVDPRMGVYMHTYPEIPQSAHYLIQLENMEAESLTGVKSFHDGVSGNSLGDVAAGVRGALDAASKRELGILRRLADGIVRIGRRFMSMNAEFLNEEEVVRVTDEQFVTIRKDDLAGNIDLKLSISTAEEDAQHADETAFLLQTLGPNVDPGILKILLTDIARLRKRPDLARSIERFQPEPNPMEQKKAELEIQLLEAKLQNEMALAQQRGSAAQLNMARAGTEGVKAGNLQADTDLKSLEFVEQESGVKQERQLELVGEQSRAQGETKKLEYQLKDQLENKSLLREYVKSSSQPE